MQCCTDVCCHMVSCDSLACRAPTASQPLPTALKRGLMTTATPIPAAAGYPPMDQTTEADPADPPPDAPPPGLASPPAVAARPTLRGQIAENPLASFLGAMVVALLVSMLATTNIRINRLEDRLDAGFAAQDAKFDA